ncbi:MAG: AMP-binding protein [Myxococcales bacterium]|nr:AMP-binding protein [Myxococcales bacterium]
MKPIHSYTIDQTRHLTLLQAFLAREEVHDIGVTYLDPEGVEHAYSWGEMVQRARKRASWLQTHLGLRTGQTLGLALPNHPHFIECLFACWMVGGIAVPLPQPGLFGGKTQERSLFIVQDAGFASLLCAEEDADYFAPLAKTVKIVKILEEDITDTPPLFFDKIPISPEQTGLLQYTSGSTVKPRGVMLRHSNLAQNCRGMAEGYPFYEDESFASWLPFYHDMGLIAELLLSIYTARVRFLAMQRVLSSFKKAAWEKVYWRSASGAKPAAQKP